MLFFKLVYVKVSFIISFFCNAYFSLFELQKKGHLSIVSESRVQLEAKETIMTRVT